MAVSRLLRYARDLLGAVAPSEILARACDEVRTTADATPVYGVLHEAQVWEDAKIVVVGPLVREASATERSALFAVFRRISRARSPLSLPRVDETKVLYAALAAEASRAVLQAVPLLDRIGRVQGTLVAVVDPHRLDPATDNLLTEIAQLCSAGVENARRLANARRDQERLLLLSETADEALWDWDLNTNEVWWGGGIEAIFGGGGVMVTTRPTWRSEHIHREDVQRVMASLQMALQGTVSSWTGEYRFRRADGQWIHVRDRAWFLREADGRCYRVIGVLRDVSSLRESLEREQSARAEAERASLTKDEFLAMLGHELRNPLAPIVSALRLSERKGGGLAPLQVQVIERQTQHLVRLVDDLLDISRIRSGKVELSRLNVTLVDIVQRAVEQAGPLVEQRRHRLDVDVEDLLLDVDSARIAQVLANLLGNAAKYTEPGGNIRVWARREGERVRIEVQDDGIGMDSGLLAHVFESFVQGRQTLDRGRGGLGLGLSIVKTLVELHGGSVEAHSDGPGQGTTLTVWLPIAPLGARASSGERPRAVPLQSRRPLKLLLVDDNEDAAHMLGELLVEGGHEVRVAYGGEPALALVDEFAPDVGLLDIGLPGMSGYELAARLRGKLGQNLRLVALTGYGQESDRQRALEAGFDAHLVKPVDTEVLDSLIRQFSPSAVGAGE